MEIARISVTGNLLSVTARKPITAGTIGATVSFNFDSSWDGLQKTFVWTDGVITKDDLIGTGVVPWEVVTTAGRHLRVGVFGTGEGIATPTIWAGLGRILEAADPSGDESADPQLPVWAQVEQKMESAVVAPPVAAVGQTIVVKSVDESGKPTEWETVELPEGFSGSWNDLADRPFHDVITESVFEKTLIPVDEPFVLLKPLYPGDTYAVTIEGGTENLVAQTYQVICSDSYGPPTLEFKSEYGWQSVYTESADSVTAHFRSRGQALYLTIDHVVGNIKQLDPKFIPDEAIPEVPATLPNPHKLTLTGAVSAEYDGSAEVTVEIPQGGGGEEWELISSGELTEEVQNLGVTADNDGNPFALKKGFWKVTTAGSAQNANNQNAAFRVQKDAGAYEVATCQLILRSGSNATYIIFETYADAVFAVAKQSASTTHGICEKGCADGIKAVYLNGYNTGGWFGVGSTWELWGVRK